MGANPTQAKGIVLFMIGFTLIALGLAEDVSYLAIALGLGLLGASAALFLRCKSWEYDEE